MARSSCGVCGVVGVHCGDVCERMEHRRGRGNDGRVDRAAVDGTIREALLAAGVTPNY